ncbi:MAG TPA: CdaR family protein, partial [Fimbriimonas sp.]|nr:CdaR family protein [Fimbriimonas sp.]
VYLAGVEPGTKSLPIVVFPPMVRDMLVNSSQAARVTIEPLITKPVEVEVAKVGALPAGMVEEGIDPLPRRVFVRAPAEALKKVSKVLVSINLADANTQNGEIEVEAKAVDAKGLPVEKILLLVSDDETKYNAVTLAEPFMIRVRIKSGPAPTIP